MLYFARMTQDELLTHFRNNYMRLVLWTRFQLGNLKRNGMDLNSRLDPEDILQDTYLTASKRADTVTQQDPPVVFAWLRSIVDNTIRDLKKHHLDAKKRTIYKEVPIGQMRTPSGFDFNFSGKNNETPSKSFEETRRYSELYDLFDQLPDVQKEAILLMKIGGLSAAEAATRLAQSRQAIYIHVAKGCARLIDLMKSHRDDFPYLIEQLKN